MFGLNGGYDSRPVKSGGTDTGISVTNKKTVGFQQIALNAEAVSNSWTLNGYGLIPVGDVEQKLNSFYQGGALNTYGLDAGYFITPVLKASVGYYYQHREQEHVDGSGVRGRLAYEISNGLTAGVNISYDEAFDTRVSADLKVRFGGASTTAAKKKKWENPTINALTASPKDRDVRVHDKARGDKLGDWTGLGLEHVTCQQLSDPLKYCTRTTKNTWLGGTETNWHVKGGTKDW